MLTVETREEARKRLMAETQLALQCGLSDWWVTGDPILPSGAKLEYGFPPCIDNPGPRFDALGATIRHRIAELVADGGAECVGLSDLIAVAEESESPIESAIGIELKRCVHSLDRADRNTGWFLGQQARVLIDGTIVARLDFVILGCKWDEGSICPYFAHQPHVVLAIECDGHDFHEKTKEQARRDKSRDRLLMANGIHTIRFTGSEVFRRAQVLWESDIDPVLRSLSGGSTR